MKGWTIVFDLDGTLIDTAPDLAAATNHVLRTLSLAPVNESEIRPFVGNGALAMIDGAARAQGRNLSERELHDLFEVFVLHYADNIAVESRPYPGIVTAMEQLRSQGATLAVCTNKIERHARAVIEALGLTGFFAAIAGRDTLGAYKPDPRHLSGTVDMSRGDIAKSLMVGDSETDIRTAQAANVPVVAVSFGYSIEPVALYGPDVVIDSFSELNQALRALAGSRVNT